MCACRSSVTLGRRAISRFTSEVRGRRRHFFYGVKFSFAVGNQCHARRDEATGKMRERSSDVGTLSNFRIEFELAMVSKKNCSRSFGPRNNQNNVKRDTHIFSSLAAAIRPFGGDLSSRSELLLDLPNALIEASARKEKILLVDQIQQTRRFVGCS